MERVQTGNHMMGCIRREKAESRMVCAFCGDSIRKGDYIVVVKSLDQSLGDVVTHPDCFFDEVKDLKDRINRKFQIDRHKVFALLTMKKQELAGLLGITVQGLNKRWTIGFKEEDGQKLSRILGVKLERILKDAT
jgi:hypothetical protein